MKTLLMDYIGELITAFLGLFGMYITNLMNRKKHRAEIKSYELDNMEKSVTFYQRLLDDVEQRFDKKLTENSKEIENLRNKLEETKKYWQERYNTLKKEFDNYKKEHP